MRGSVSPPQQQRLIFAGKQHRPEALLRDYGVTRSSLVQLCLSVTGGAYAEPQVTSQLNGRVTPLRGPAFEEGATKASARWPSRTTVPTGAQAGGSSSLSRPSTLRADGEGAAEACSLSTTKEAWATTTMMPRQSGLQASAERPNAAAAAAGAPADGACSLLTTKEARATTTMMPRQSGLQASAERPYAAAAAAGTPADGASSLLMTTKEVVVVVVEAPLMLSKTGTLGLLPAGTGTLTPSREPSLQGSAVGSSLLGHASQL